jgi:membrane associated rhomboid family serine protease
MWIIPVERDNPIRHRPYVVYALLLLNLAAAIATLAAGPEAVYRDFGFVPTEPSWTTLLTSMFLHGSLWHLLGNMFFLWMFGDNVEDVLGSVTFVAVYLLSGAAAVGLHLVMSPESHVPLIGASGAISGILGVYAAFFPRVPTDLSIILLRWEVKTFHVTALGAIGVWFGEQLLLGWVTAVSGLDEYIPIAFWAHVGGLVFGAALGAALVRCGCMRHYTGGGRHPLLGYLPYRPSSPAPPDERTTPPTD